MRPGGDREVALVVCALAMAGLVAGCGDAQAEADTRAFLAGPGAPLLVMHRAAVEQAQGSSSPTECRTRAQALQQQLDGEQALALSSQVPDQELAAGFTSERSALARSLSTCAQGAAVPPDINLPEVTKSVEDRLNALQVVR